MAQDLYFISYLEKPEGFPRKLILERYRNWKNTIMDLKIHAACDYHNTSMAKLNALKKTYIDGSCRIDVTFTDANTKQVEQNKIILKSLVKC